MHDTVHMLHKKVILHRNINLTNILISHNLLIKDIPFTIKLGDLGLTSQLKAVKSHPIHKVK